MTTVTVATRSILGKPGAVSSVTLPASDFGVTVFMLGFGLVVRMDRSNVATMIQFQDCAKEMTNEPAALVIAADIKAEHITTTFTSTR